MRKAKKKYTLAERKEIYSGLVFTIIILTLVTTLCGAIMFSLIATKLSYTEVEATIIEAETINKEPKSRGNVGTPNYNYYQSYKVSYELDGVEYESHVSFAKTDENGRNAGEKLVVYINPSNFSEAKTEEQFELKTQLLIGSALIIVFYCVYLGGYIRKVSKKKKDIDARHRAENNVNTESEFAAWYEQNKS